MRDIQKLHIVFFVVIIIILAYSFFLLSDIRSLVDVSLADVKELQRPANVSLSIISDPACLDCSSLDSVVQTVLSSNVNIVSQNAIAYPSEEAQALISKYSLSSLPAIILTGETDKKGFSVSGLTNVDDALIYSATKPVYLDLATGKYRGRVQITIINPEDCIECYNISSFADAIGSVAVVSSVEKVSSSEAAGLIEANNITELPALLLSGDLDLYTDFVTTVEKIGAQRVGNNLIITAALNPPYWDIKNNEVRGLVNLTYLVDKSCDTCYNYNVHRTILENYGVKIVSEETIDIASKEGKDLVKLYNITKVPTVLLSSDMQYYPQMDLVWKQVGNVEDDGVYVFREVDLVSSNYTAI